MADEPESFSRRLLQAFLKELPWLLGSWLVVTLALIVFGVMTGDMTPREALTIAVSFLPLAIPLAPLTWMRWEPRATTPRAFPAIGLGCLWSALTLPVAIGLSVLLTRLLNAL